MSSEIVELTQKMVEILSLTPDRETNIRVLEFVRK